MIRCKRILAGLVIAAVPFVGGCSSSSVDHTSAIVSSPLTSESDSLAYIVGLNVAEQLVKMDSAINYRVVARAIVEKLDGVPLMDDEDARTAYLRYMLYVAPERKRGYEERFLADLARNDRSFTRTKSGLTYNIETIGNESLTPKTNSDWLTISYTISRVGGERVFPADVDEVERLEVSLDELPQGVEESLKLIGKGGKIKAWIPSKLAYGEDGDEEMGVEPIETLYYEIELLELERNKAAQRKKERKTF